MTAIKCASMFSRIVTHEHKSQGGYHYDSETQQLSLSGYLHGVPPLNLNALVHVMHTFAKKTVVPLLGQFHSDETMHEVPEKKKANQAARTSMI